jgi:hypothetical protein
MTRRATLQLPYTLNLVFRRQALADFRLIRGSFPVHIENLITRAQYRFRIAMTVQAPMHEQRRSLKHQRHLINFAVTRRAANALIHVNAVIEINVIREAMYAHPLDGFVGAITLADRLQVADVIEQDGMAIHAGFCGRDAGGGGGFHSRMAIATINAIIANVMFVTELNGLLARDVLVSQIGSTRQTHHGAEREGRQQSPKEDTELGDKIRAAVKNLGHVNFALFR